MSPDSSYVLFATRGCPRHALLLGVAWTIACTSPTELAPAASGRLPSDASSRTAITPEDTKAFFRERGKYVLTFLGYSGTGYERRGGHAGQGPARPRRARSEDDPNDRARDAIL